MSLDLTIAALSGVIVSLVFNWFPKVADWYAAKPKPQKQWLMLGVLGISSLLSFGIACLELPSFQPGLTCNAAGARQVFDYFLIMVIANQSAYAILPAPARIEEIKAKHK